MISSTPREGDIYSIVNVGGHSFTIRYGYYSQEERHTQEPIPVYPCFEMLPHYTEEGFPLVTRIQDACEFYKALEGSEGDRWCADCIYCEGIQDEIGICKCQFRRRSDTG